MKRTTNSAPIEGATARVINEIAMSTPIGSIAGKKTIVGNDQIQNPGISNEHERDLADCVVLYGNAHSYGFGDVKYAMVPVRLLHLDASYQRKVERAHVNELVVNWNNNECNHIAVNFRDDKVSSCFYVVDGQHRLEAAIRMGMVALPCKIYHKLSRSQEAMMFAEQGARTKKINSFAKFRALVAAEDPAAMKVAGICAAHGVSTASKPAGTPSCLGGMSTIMRIYKAGGADTVEKIFDTIEKCGWHACPGAYNSHILSAIYNVYSADGFGASVTNRILKKIGDLSPVAAVCKARSLNTDLGPTRALVKYLMD